MNPAPAVRRMLAFLGKPFVYTLKMSSLVSVIGLEVVAAEPPGQRAHRRRVNRTLEICTVLVASWRVRRLEERLRGYA